MKPQEKRLIVIIVAAICVGAILGAIGFYFISSLHSSSQTTIFSSSAPSGSSNIAPVSTTSSVILGTGSTSTSATSSISNSNSGPAPVDMSDWKTYSNYELGFSFQYPPDLVLDTSNPSAVTLTFPSSYFSTAMADADSFSVTVSATCTPEQSFDDKDGIIPAQSMNISGISFVENSQESVGAGSHSNATIYQGNNNNVCYIIEYASHGPDSPDNFATSQAQINSMGTAYTNDASNIQAIVSNIISTFAFISTPAGENEADYSAQQQSSASAPGSGSGYGSASGSGLINLSSLSTTTVSVGSALVLTGSGFSGQNTIVWISNGSVQGVLWGGTPSSDTSINAIIPSQTCTQYTGASGGACPSYLVLAPGVYTVSVSNQNGSTNPTYIRVQ